MGKKWCVEGRSTEIKEKRRVGKWKEKREKEKKVNEKRERGTK